MLLVLEGVVDVYVCTLSKRMLSPEIYMPRSVFLFTLAGSHDGGGSNFARSLAADSHLYTPQHSPCLCPKTSLL